MTLNNSLSIQLPQFEGPLGLLLYLIRKEEMDILDIPIQKITGQYLEFIKLMKELDLEMAGEFIAMASTLIQIKSRMLLPQYDENGEIVETEDPRKELVQRLMEYQKYQEAAHSLYQRPLLGRDVWARGVREKLETPEENIIIEENGLFALISAYRAVVKTAKKKIHEVTNKLQSIASRILEMKDQLIVGQRVAMSTLISTVQDKHRQVLITFLSSLELGKMGFVNLFQSDVYQEIWIEARKPIETDVVSQVEEYNNINSETLAQGLIEKFDAKTTVSLDFEEIAEGESTGATTEIVLKDSTDLESEQFDEPLYASSEMASDEEIETAERELSSEPGLDEGMSV